jgi:hypothetical protein
MDTQIAKALMLYLRLNADAMNYTPRSHRGQRAARLMPLIRAKHFPEDR